MDVTRSKTVIELAESPGNRNPDRHQEDRDQEAEKQHQDYHQDYEPSTLMFIRDSYPKTVTRSQASVFDELTRRRSQLGRLFFECRRLKSENERLRRVLRENDIDLDVDRGEDVFGRHQPKIKIEFSSGVDLPRQVDWLIKSLKSMTSMESENHRDLFEDDYDMFLVREDDERRPKPGLEQKKRPLIGPGSGDERLNESPNRKQIKSKKMKAKNKKRLEKIEIDEAQREEEELANISTRFNRKSAALAIRRFQALHDSDLGEEDADDEEVFPDDPDDDDYGSIHIEGLGEGEELLTNEDLFQSAYFNDLDEVRQADCNWIKNVAEKVAGQFNTVKEMLQLDKFKGKVLFPALDKEVKLSKMDIKRLLDEKSPNLELVHQPNRMGGRMTGDIWKRFRRVSVGGVLQNFVACVRCEEIYSIDRWGSTTTYRRHKCKFKGEEPNDDHFDYEQSPIVAHQIDDEEDDNDNDDDEDYSLDQSKAKKRKSKTNTGLQKSEIQRLLQEKSESIQLLAVDGEGQIGKLPRRSDVWKRFYRVSVDGQLTDYVACINCEDIYTIDRSGSTSLLRKHMCKTPGDRSKQEVQDLVRNNPEQVRYEEIEGKNKVWKKFARIVVDDQQQPFVICSNCQKIFACRDNISGSIKRHECQVGEREDDDNDYDNDDQEQEGSWLWYDKEASEPVAKKARKAPEPLSSGSSSASASASVDFNATLKARIQQLVIDQDPSVTFVMVEGKSDVWKTFRRIVLDGQEQEFVICEWCKEVYAAKDGSTSGMKKHKCKGDNLE